MPLTKDDILEGFQAPEQASSSSMVTGDELRRSMIEEQVNAMRDRQRKGERPPAITPRAPNPRKEEIVGTKQPRLVGLPPGTIESGLEMLGGAGGATAGALYGAEAGAPFGPLGATIGGVGGGIIGAGLGLAGTRAGVESAKAAAGMRPPISTDEAIASGKRALMEGMIGEGVFRTGASIPAAYRGVKSRLLGGTIAPAERELYGQAQALGIHLPPSTLTEDKAPQIIENTLRRTLSAGGKFKAMDIQNELNLRKAVDDWADQTMGKYTDPVTQGKLLKDAIENKAIPEHEAMVSALYQNLDKKTGDAKIVDTKDLYTELQGIRDQLAKRGDTYKAQLSTLDDVLERISDKGPVTGLTVKRKTEDERLTGLKVTEKSDAPRTPKNLTFQEAQRIRSIIGREVGQGGPPLPDGAAKSISKAYAVMSDEMGKAASNHSLATGSDVNLSWALADTMSRRGKELYNESVIAKVLDRNPEQVVKTVFQKDAITPTRDLVRALESNPEALNLYRRNVVESLIRDATNDETGRVVGEKFAKMARKRGTEVLQETFGENYPAFQKLLEIAERMPKENKQGLVWYEQGLYLSSSFSALGSQMFSNPSAAATFASVPAAWIITTKRLAEIMTNKELANKLLSVPKLSPGSQAFGRTMAQLGAIEVGETGQPVEGQQEPKRGLMTGLTQKLME